MTTAWQNRLGAAALALGMIAGTAAARAQEEGGTMVMVVQPEPPTLASYLSTSGPIGQVVTKVYEGLLSYDFDLQPQPALAESWEISEDGLSITFKLREGVEWHDGEPFTSADVAFSIMEVLKQVHPRGATTFRDVEAIETPDELTAVFKLANPAPYMMAALSGYESPIVAKHLFEGTDIRNNPTANAPVGTGPFEFVEWEKGQYIRLDRNDDYWREGLPHLDRVVARFIADGSTRAAVMENEEAQYAAFGAVPYIDVARLEELPYIAVTTRGYETLSPTMQLQFNTEREPFGNKLVRQAIAHAMDRDFVIENIWYGFGKPATGPISSNFAASGIYTDDVMDYTQGDRIAIANQLLDEAGYPRDANGIRFSIVHDLTPYGEEWRRFGEYTKQVLAELGIAAELRYEDVPTWLKRIYTDYDYDLSNNWLYGLTDPVLGVHRQYHSDSIRPGTVFVNGTKWTSDEADALMDQATIETDAEKRKDLYHQLQKLIVEEAPIVFMHEMQFATVYNTKLHGADAPLGAYGDFAEMWLEQ